MPYGVAKAREGDPVQWIANKLDREAGGAAPVVEADDEATPADQASAAQQAAGHDRVQARCALSAAQAGQTPADSTVTMMPLPCCQLSV